MKLRQRVRLFLIILSFILFPATIFYFSPYLIIMASGYGIVNGSMIVFIAMFLSSLFLGRLWCGWLCAGAGISEALFAVQNKKASNRHNWIKYAIWVPWIIIIVVAAVSAGGYKKIDFFVATTNGFSVVDLHGYIIYFVVVGTIVTLSLTTGRRGFCHYGCWMAPFMTIGHKISTLLHLPSVRLVSDKSKCTDCLSCTKKCPMSLEVNAMVQKDDMGNSECVLCGTCADTCAKEVIKYSLFK
ncbi:MAG: 4Fe-4S binding protein [Planctomycetes bacterium]|nr:4Fe-4S binding protein [Planctomycetota bacterium]